ncbi:5-hydroxytryptamine (serotonin) receptor 1A a isoform X2 [Acanthopagrus latus]|uniref:5-hydroxytryptamine (serotonin) receptor 1A a isoform X2 n=1 Tax=Acanthopagrus latus TaxID=8177 RepID=UPI00187CE6D6|nr:5-hydroxytryptamine (serotonin) receptor 1A a isoform X2 [Acanthopagrus latus]
MDFLTTSGNDSNATGGYPDGVDVVADWDAGENGTGSRSVPDLQLSYQIITSLLLAALILCSIFGNACVVAAIALERSLQNVANYLIGSLAVTDLMVSVLVLPMAALYQVLNKWTLGQEICDVFISLDVLCCTSSILHLCAIALDRLEKRRRQGEPRRLQHQPGPGLHHLLHVWGFLHPSHSHARPVRENIQGRAVSDSKDGQENREGESVGQVLDCVSGRLSQENQRGGRGQRLEARRRVQTELSVRKRRGEARGGGRVAGDHRSYQQLQDAPSPAQHPPVLVARLREHEREELGGEEKDRAGQGAQNGENAGDHHGDLHLLLAALFHRGAGAAFLRGELLHARLAGRSHKLAGLLQLPPQPHHICLLQQRLPKCFQEDYKMQIPQSVKTLVLA